MTGADRKALETALADVGQDAPVIERAIASGAPVAAIAALAASWRGLDPHQRAIIRHPLGAAVPGRVEWQGVHVTQVDHPADDEGQSDRHGRPQGESDEGGHEWSSILRLPGRAATLCPR